MSHLGDQTTQMTVLLAEFELSFDPLIPKNDQRQVWWKQTNQLISSLLTWADIEINWPADNVDGSIAQLAIGHCTCNRREIYLQLLKCPS